MEIPGFDQGNSENSSVRSGLVAFVLDNQKGELVAASVGRMRDGAEKEKAAVALRNHSEAERRRRERINGHLATLRGLIPGTTKMDKASLLAKVISKVKELKKHAVEITRGLVIPFDDDEVRVEESKEASDGSPFYITASLCCDYSHEIISDLRQALEALNLKILRADIATLGGRMKAIFVMTGIGEEAGDFEVPKHHSGSVQASLRSILDRYSASQELSREMLSNKRRRIGCVDYSSAYPSYDYW